jgi:hypothetical protein
MRYQFLVSAGAREDMLECARADRRAAADIAIFLQEVMDDATACEALIDTSVYYEDGIESVDLFAFMQDQRVNAYRVRLVNVGEWRIISAADHKGKRVGIFGVMHRDRRYQEDVAYCRRIETEYDNYDFPRY